MSGNRTTILITSYHVRGFQSLAQHTQLCISEIMRRMFDYCFQSHVMDQMFPVLSGQISVGG